MSVDIVAENARTDGRTPWADIRLSGHGNLWAAGFVRKVSYNVGETAQFSMSTPWSTEVRIYRCGWYGGDGFRLVDTITNTIASQAEATTIPDSNGATTCTSWTVTAEWEIPADACTGMYLAVAFLDGAPAFYVGTFVVRDDAAVVDVIYKTSDSTWAAAYNHYGTPADTAGRNVYGAGTGVGNIMERSFAVDYHRPVITRGTVPQTYWFACEMPLIRFLERNGYSMKYISCVDLDQEGVSILAGMGDVFISSGHDEYWTLPMRRAVESFRDDHGGRSIFMSGNEVFWKARYVYDGDRATLWCYKDTMPGPNGITRGAGSSLDPVEWTGTWKDTRWPDREPEWLLTGTDFRMNGINDENAVIVRNPYAGIKTWGGSSLVDGDITLVGVVGFEADSMRPTQPSRSVRVLAAYTRNINGKYADDNGQNYTGNGNLTWGIIAQRYAGGGVTVGFGTCQWAWALDAAHDRGESTPVSLDAQQFTVNLLRDLGADPGTVMDGVELQAVNSLDEYGFEPGVTPPGTTFTRDGRPILTYAKVGGVIIQIGD